MTRTSIFFNSKLSFFSLTYFHNETINILTHAGANKQVSLYCCLFLFSSCVPNRGGRSLDASLGRDLRPLAPIDPRCCLHGALGEIVVVVVVVVEIVVACMAPWVRLVDGR